MKESTQQSNLISKFLIQRQYRGYRHLILQAAILTISIGIFFDAPDKLNLTTDRFYGWISYHIFLNCLVYFNTWVLFPTFLAKNRFVAYLFSIILFTLVALCIMVVLQELFYDIAVTRQQPSPIAIILSITSSMLAILLFLGGISALQLFKQWLINNYKINELKRTTFHTQQHFLKSQVNPHFLFNMINNANILVDEDPITASFILKKLEEMLQYQFNDNGTTQVSLIRDIDFLKDYLELEKLRRDHCDYYFSTEGQFDQIRVPPMLFIHFVENAVKHSADSKNSTINIAFKLVDRQLFFRCENSKPRIPLQRDIGGLGLDNIRQRLHLLYSEKHQLNIAETETNYTVTLHLHLQ